MSKKKIQAFEIIIKDILNNDKFKKMDNELHHGLTRYNHSLRVAKTTYKCTKALGLDYVSATRAALLHDFYINTDFPKNLPIIKLSNHPTIALKNAKTYYDISKKEENIIISHMFPFCYVAPKYLESWVVSLVDKSVAIYEMYRYKLSLVLTIWIMFLFNMITLNK